MLNNIDNQLRSKFFKVASYILSGIFFAGGSAYTILGLSYVFGPVFLISSILTLLGIVLYRKGVRLDVVVWIPIEATKLLRAKYDNLPPLVALSANAMEGDEEKYTANGFDGYISKPITTEKVYKGLKGIIN